MSPGVVSCPALRTAREAGGAAADVPIWMVSALSRGLGGADDDAELSPKSNVRKRKPPMAATARAATTRTDGRTCNGVLCSGRGGGSVLSDPGDMAFSLAG
ncbi:hypothetical protein GCM10010344_01500 [Streptomyces bluensis]|nr:hypothetical protein GCM10010344_01500 [Streptomyces bluensis]